MTRLATIQLQGTTHAYRKKDGSVAYTKQMRFTLNDAVIKSLGAEEGDFLDLIKEKDGRVVIVVVKGYKKQESFQEL